MEIRSTVKIMNPDNFFFLSRLVHIQGKQTLQRGHSQLKGSLQRHFQEDQLTGPEVKHWRF